MDAIALQIPEQLLGSLAAGNVAVLKHAKVPRIMRCSLVLDELEGHEIMNRIRFLILSSHHLISHRSIITLKTGCGNDIVQSLHIMACCEQIF